MNNRIFAMFSCVHCKKPISSAKLPFCKVCDIAWQSAILETPRPKDDIESLFFYRDFLRQLILKIKIEYCHASLEFMLEHLVNKAANLSVVKHASAIMPMPSSLWSRMRGRCDLAYFFAWHLAKAASKSFIDPPFSTGWHLRKRSKISRQKREVEFFNCTSDTPQSRMVGETYTLVVDDIVTTGQSLYSLRQALPSQRLKLLTIAASA